MNEYIHHGDVHAEAAANFSRTYIALLGDQFVGFVSILADSIRLGTRERPHGIQYATAPAVKIGRLAVCQSVQHQGLGATLISYVVGHTRAHVCGGVGCRYVTLDALPHKAGWYGRQGFIVNDAERRIRKNDRAATRKTPLTTPLPTVSMRFDIFGE